VTQVEISEESFAGELAADEEQFPEGFPLSCKETACQHEHDNTLHNELWKQPELCNNKNTSTQMRITKGTRHVCLQLSLTSKLPVIEHPQAPPAVAMQHEWVNSQALTQSWIF